VNLSSQFVWEEKNMLLKYRLLVYTKVECEKRSKTPLIMENVNVHNNQLLGISRHTHTKIYLREL
jgi:hypothetical protein